VPELAAGLLFEQRDAQQFSVRRTVALNRSPVDIGDRPGQLEGDPEGVG